MKKLWDKIKPKSRREWIFLVLAVLAVILVLYVTEYLGWDLPIRMQDRMLEK
ncbi:hypothetical protein G7L40_00635 [Paenibacillus polymyxa]|uniref:hypothetical protein n=1 Tax=Paenibacillus polymyxa TaxID=1406 RepID=UPI00036F7559|nr:hypothetical protein [Paenibacillus polymyxa]MBE7897216.1 hypothetical protein [Paenibacillus polymyxa]MCC3257534.1 hypothetical protein [Paenibacillus polymyxa]QPK51378.1 hypothetical protein G7035_00630 [Paenibacillus polymyxa]QPK56469.1 hypothetical protein G7L40_00635 [Paenibacillus polymyxa]